MPNRVDVGADFVVRDDVLQVHEELVALEQRFAQRVPAVRLPLVAHPRCARARSRTLGPVWPRDAPQVFC